MSDETTRLLIKVAASFAGSFLGTIVVAACFLVWLMRKRP